jgi:hypothetical protein
VWSDPVPFESNDGTRHIVDIDAEEVMIANAKDNSDEFEDDLEKYLTEID